MNERDLFSHSRVYYGMASSWLRCSDIIAQHWWRRSHASLTGRYDYRTRERETQRCRHYSRPVKEKRDVGAHRFTQSPTRVWFAAERCGFLSHHTRVLSGIQTLGRPSFHVPVRRQEQSGRLVSSPIVVH